MTKSQINKLGKSLKKSITSNTKIETDDLIKLQNYRISFNEDLTKVFGHISNIAKENRSDSIVAFRIKRIESILSKIKRQPTMALSNMGDIAGCRIIVYDDRIIYKIVEKIGLAYEIKYHNDYTIKCKDDGYRGYHLYIKSPINDDRLIEVQIRSIKAHKWASMVEIIDLLYEIKIKEGEKNAELQRFLFLLSKEDNLTTEEKKEIIEIDKYKGIRGKLIEVFLQNHYQIRQEWHNLVNSNVNQFIFEVDKNKKSHISSFSSYEEAELAYFEKFKSKEDSNFVLTYIAKPKFNNICIAYASYILNNHNYLNDWYTITSELIEELINTKNNIDAEKYRLYVQENLEEQLGLLKSEMSDLTKYRNEKNVNIDGLNDWLDDVKEKLLDITKIVIDHEIIKPSKRNNWFKNLFK